MGLYIIGLGLDFPDGITVRGLGLARSASIVLIERYTSFLPSSLAKLEKLLRKRIRQVSREDIEESEWLIEAAKEQTVALLVPGDPLFATTHIELVLRLEKEGIPVEILHNASIVNAILDSGLQGYKFGRTVTLPRNFSPELRSPYNYIRQNRSSGLHTLVLFDTSLQEKEPLRPNEAVETLLDMEKRFRGRIINQKERWLGCARLGTLSKKLIYATPLELKTRDWGKPPYCLVIPGKLHFIEEEALLRFSI